MTLIDLIFARPVFSPDDDLAGGAGNDTVETTADDDLLGDDTSTPEDTTTSDDADLLDDTPAGEDTVAPVEPETLDREAIKAALPEGFQITDEENFNAFLEQIEKAPNRQALATELLTVYTKQVAALEQEQAEVWNTMQTAWKKDAREDPEFGGDKLGTSLATAKATAKEFGGDDFLQLLKLTGAGNHRSMIAFLNKVHAALPQEGRPIMGQPAGGGAKTLADRLFST